MESTARKCFSAQTGLKVDLVGLVIDVHQSFLATSPDGIIISENALLEIKCPFSCQDKVIINHDEKEANIPYVEIDEENNVLLKKTINITLRFKFPCTFLTCEDAISLFTQPKIT